MNVDAAEFERRNAHLAKLAQFFRAHELTWIESRELERIAGRNAWRTRVSDCRVKLGMTIENRQQRISTDDGFAILSEYRYLPYQPLGPDASAYRTQKSLF